MKNTDYKKIPQQMNFINKGVVAEKVQGYTKNMGVKNPLERTYKLKYNISFNS